jgi:hypothetical protein
VEVKELQGDFFVELCGETRATTEWAAASWSHSCNRMSSSSSSRSKQPALISLHWAPLWRKKELHQSNTKKKTPSGHQGLLRPAGLIFRFNWALRNNRQIIFAD